MSYQLKLKHKQFCMQTLSFNTTTKSVKVTADRPEDSKILYLFENVPTVKVTEFYYEVMSEIETEDGNKRIPVARFPISNTNMLISK